MRMLHLFVLAMSMAGLMTATDARVRAMDPLPAPDPAPEPAPPGGANPVVGKTEIKIGNPQYQGNPPTKAILPITMELDSTTKGFTGILVQAKTVPLIGKGTPVPVTLTLAAPPQPGKGPVTINATLPVVKGTKYQIDARMDYTDSTGAATFKPI